MAYQVHVIRGKYRLPTDCKRYETTNATTNLREFDSVAHLIRGDDRTCSSVDCVGGRYRNFRDGGKTGAECIDRMRMRLKPDGRNHMYSRGGVGNVSIASPKRSAIPNPTQREDKSRANRSSPRSNSSDLLGSGDSDLAPSLTKHIQTVRPTDLSQRRIRPREKGGWISKPRITK